MRCDTHRACASDWHLGQCRLRHELYEGSFRPHSRHTSRCPPSTAVRQRSMARSTACWSVDKAWSRRNASPCSRTMSASSTAGRVGAPEGPPQPCTSAGAQRAGGVGDGDGEVGRTGAAGSRSSGLTSCFTRAVLMCRYSAVLRIEACPRRTCTVRRSTPCSSKSVAKPCRSVWAVTRTGMPQRRAAFAQRLGHRSARQRARATPSGE